MEECHIIEEIPVSEFWQYFDKTLYPMTAGDKINFMNS
jgi:hypothetical protein